ncbi:partial Serine/threonine-protein kinase Pkn1, partial [Anaerolineae bacterium]
ETQTGMEFVRIHAGQFLMGSIIGEPDRNPNERQHKVSIAQDFFIAKYPVTQAQWQKIMGNNPSQFTGDRLPVERVSWIDVQLFIEKLSTLSKQTFRLPTEAEWEYACRAGTTTPFYTGDSVELNQANFANQIGKTSQVGLYPANPWGLYDMIGNVWEWTGSEYDEHYQGLENQSVQKATSSWRVVRGGLWNAEARNLRSANRHTYTSDFRYSSIGFRLVRV